MVKIEQMENIVETTGKKDKEKGSYAPRRRKGGLIVMPFIFGQEIGEKLAIAGFNHNLMTYLTTQLHMPITKAATTISTTVGTSQLTPLLGAFIADSYIGRFWTIFVASIIYVIGMCNLTISAIFPKLRPPPCRIGPSGHQVCPQATSKQLSIMYASVFLNAIASGGIKPCVVAFGADQLEVTDENQNAKTWNYFNWYYFIMGSTIVVGMTLVVYVQENVGWGIGLGIPTICMFLSLIAFGSGYPLYRRMEPDGSPFTRLVQVLVAAFKKKNLTMVSDPGMLYQSEKLDAKISTGGRLVHTKEMNFLNKAAMVTPADNQKEPNLWRISTVHRVEEVKCLIKMFPIWASGILLYTAYAQQSTFSLHQAKTMDRRLTKSFEIPAGSMGIFSYIPMLMAIAIYDRLIIPIARRLTGIDRGMSFLQRMGIGFAISTMATFVAGFVEIKRKNVAVAHGLIDDPSARVPISVFWLTPQYSLHGIAEAFMTIGHLEFFYDQAPESMRSTAAALFWASNSAGQYLSTFVVTLVHKYTAGRNGSNWLPDQNLNKGKLENFWWLLTALQFVNFICYLFCANMYRFKPIQVATNEEDVTEVFEVNSPLELAQIHTVKPVQVKESDEARLL